MLEIKDLLSKFNNIILSGEGRKQVLKEALFEVTGIIIETKNISIKNNIVYLNIKPIYKNEIFLKKDKIFEKLQNKIGINKIPDDFR